jgi:hypothetical protein
MPPITHEAVKRDRSAASLSAPELAGSLLGFLDRNLKEFKPLVRNLIGVGVLLLLAIVVLHVFVTPTYVQGTLSVRRQQGQIKSLAKSYFLVREGQQFQTNDSGHWMMPVRGMLPFKAKVFLKDPDFNDIGEFTFRGPWPIASALNVANYDLVVNLYQGAESADRIQVVRSDGSAWTEFMRAIGAPGVVHAQAAPIPLRLTVRLEGLGDVACHDAGWCGTRGQSRRLEGFTIDPPTEADVRLRYTCHLADIGDTPAIAGQFCGTRGQSRRVEGFSVSLEGPDAGRLHVKYQAWLQDRGPTPVAVDGQYAGTRGQALQVEAMRVWLEWR